MPKSKIKKRKTKGQKKGKTKGQKKRNTKKRTRNRDYKFNNQSIKYEQPNYQDYYSLFNKRGDNPPQYRIFLINAHGKACDEKHLKKSIQGCPYGGCKTLTEPLGRVNLKKYQSDKYYDNFFVLSLQNLGRPNSTYLTELLMKSIIINSKINSNLLTKKEKYDLIKKAEAYEEKIIELDHQGYPQRKQKLETILGLKFRSGYRYVRGRGKGRERETKIGINPLKNVKLLFNEFNKYFYGLIEYHDSNITEFNYIMTELYYLLNTHLSQDIPSKIFSDNKIIHSRIYPNPIRNMKQPPNTFIQFFPNNNLFEESIGIFELTIKNREGLFRIDTDFPYKTMPVYNVAKDSIKDIRLSDISSNGSILPIDQKENAIINHALGLKQNDYLNQYKKYSDKINDITKYNKVLKRHINEKVKKYIVDDNNIVLGRFNVNDPDPISFAEVAKHRTKPDDFVKPLYTNIYHKITFSLKEVLDIIHDTIAYTEYGGNLKNMKEHLNKTNTKIIVIDPTCKIIEGLPYFNSNIPHNQLSHIKKLRRMSLNGY